MEKATWVRWMVVEAALALGFSTAGCAMEAGAEDETPSATTTPQGVEAPGPAARVTGAGVSSPAARVRTPIAAHPVPLPDPVEVEPLGEVAW
jgi:hypothetical protein